MARLPVVISLDPPKDKGWDWALGIAEEMKDLVVAFKVGWPLLLEGKEKLGTLREMAPVVLDLKLADISFTMINIIRRLEFDAVIAHAFVGREKALRELREELNKQDKELYLVVAMSHKGADELLNRMWRENVLIAYELADGIVAPATRPELLVKIRKVWPRKVLSPGVGVQGARPCSAVKLGADAEIIGRTVTRNPSPREYLLRLYSGCKA
ncbi:orotidine 5'-phosphate decarboxylase / HUMPS family protein [Ignicoccus hospitalis]|uniref:Orotidine 5'-phosphate decarboxylase n=1 Tax=Ignicoccus hospitalis (strain KIN4/I / DSM 18386 / JCM 14125) TaxID=453591 RepID=A8AC82_IGNH4|nr:orotidine 5'-phosphate decarboxylase / HUMPS family protein [Ignicoccus hospitalis]ABU82534.1 orotidine 5'-phosphate decarboxylase [Ignicoccus hospitalis KIN4/I]HIH90699.1 orotidine 5'-phosphate decarboxylase [Desulfurococcaceae archaeon]